MSASKPERKAKRPLPEVVTWISSVRRTLKRNHRQLETRDVIRVAALGALVGPASSPEGRLAWTALDVIFLHPHTRMDKRYNRITHVDRVMKVLPPERENVLKLSRCLRAYTQENPGRDLKKQKFDPPDVVSVMLQIPDPETYVRHVSGGLDYPVLGAVFHPNTLERARKELRGVFGRFEGENDYWSKIQSQVNTVSDEE